MRPAARPARRSRTALAAPLLLALPLALSACAQEEGAGIGSDGPVDEVTEREVEPGADEPD